MNWSTMRWDVINHLIQKYNFQNYLEIGYDTGENFNRINCPNKVSTDPAEGIYSHATPTYKLTSDDFFKDVAPTLDKFDLIFIDGLHHADQVDKDIENSLKYLNKGGIIVLHDCNPSEEYHQVIPLQPDHYYWNGDVWKSMVRFRFNNPQIGTCVLNTDFGLGIISDKLEVTPLSLDMPQELTWEWLEKNREEALNLTELFSFSL